MSTVRGKAKIEWKPAYTLTFTSTDGTSLTQGTTTHPLVATLTFTATGNPVVGRTIRLRTNPANRIGYGERHITDENGRVTFNVSNPSVEAVIYTAALIPDPPTSEPTVTASVTINWGGVLCSACNENIDSIADKYQPAGTYAIYWYAAWTEKTFSGEDCLTETLVTKLKAVVSAIDTFIECPPPPELPLPEADSVDILCEVVPAMTGAEEDALLATYEDARAAFVAGLEADPC